MLLLPKFTRSPERAAISFVFIVPWTSIPSFIFNDVESVERIVLPEISIVPNVCVVPVPVMFVPEMLPAVNVPVVIKFSEPKLIAVESVAVLCCLIIEDYLHLL